MALAEENAEDYRKEEAKPDYRVKVIGDSVSRNLGTGLRKQGIQNNNMGSVGASIGSVNRQNNIRGVMEQLHDPKHHPRPGDTLIVLVGYNDGSNPDHAAQVEKMMAELETLQAQGVHVAIIKPPLNGARSEYLRNAQRSGPIQEEAARRHHLNIYTIDDDIPRADAVHIKDPAAFARLVMAKIGLQSDGSLSPSTTQPQTAQPSGQPTTQTTPPSPDGTTTRDDAGPVDTSPTKFQATAILDSHGHRFNLTVDGFKTAGEGDQQHIENERMSIAGDDGFRADMDLDGKITFSRKNAKGDYEPIPDDKLSGFKDLVTLYTGAMHDAKGKVDAVFKDKPALRLDFEIGHSELTPDQLERIKATVEEAKQLAADAKDKGLKDFKLHLTVNGTASLAGGGTDERNHQLAHERALNAAAELQKQLQAAGVDATVEIGEEKIGQADRTARISMTGGPEAASAAAPQASNGRNYAGLKGSSNTDTGTGPSTTPMQEALANPISKILAERRRAKFGEELKDPALRDEIAACASMETTDTQALIESLMNRADKEGLTLHQALHNGFYGPINRGQLPGRVAQLTTADRQNFDAALAKVMGGSNAVKLATDQGQPSEIKGERWVVGGEHYGHHCGDASWAQMILAQAQTLAQQLAAKQPKRDPSRRMPLAASA